MTEIDKRGEKISAEQVNRWGYRNKQTVSVRLVQLE